MSITRVDHLYAFFVQWSPNIYGGEDEIDPKDRGFVVINDSDEEDDMDVVEDHFKQERRLLRQMTKDWEVSRSCSPGPLALSGGREHLTQVCNVTIGPESVKNSIFFFPLESPG